MEALQNFFHSFLVFNANAFYCILYFLKNNYLFIIVLLAVAYIVFEELRNESGKYVNDERRML
jgi:hypothetical protein